jgi:hypothetical protein
MRLRILSAAGVTALAIVAATAFATGASAQRSTASPTFRGPVGAVHRIHPDATCYNQRSADSGNLIVSSNFEKANNAVDSQAADDFKLSTTCNLKTTAVDGGYFNANGPAPGPADSVNVTFYKNKNGKPGVVIKTFKGLAFNDPDGTGSFKVKTKITLDPGHYWISVQPNINFTNTSSEWGWAINTAIKGAEARWQNPKDGFGTGCTSYASIGKCIGVDGDLSFSLTPAA